MPITLPPLSRRQFLAQSLVAAGALMARPRSLAAASAANVDPHTWALLSDTHIAADRAKVNRDVAMAAHLEAVVRDVIAQARRPVAALVNGDLALNSGESADYATFTSLIAPLRAAQIPLHLALGNHDNRERFWAALHDDATAKRPVADRQVAFVPAARANWFILDTLDKTNSTPGLLGEAQLAWLARELDAHTDKPALVVTHHNPASDPAKPSLLDEAALYAVLRPRRHVKAHFFGHSHVWSIKPDESGLHRINLPAVAYVFEPTQPSGWVNAQLELRGIKLQLRCVDPTHRLHGESKELVWRT